MRRNDSFLLKNIGGEALLVPIGSQVKRMNGIVMLNATGCLLWDVLSEDRQLQDLVTAIAERFAVDAQRARADVESFVKEMQQLGLVEA